VPHTATPTAHHLLPTELLTVPSQPHAIAPSAASTTSLNPANLRTGNTSPVSVLVLACYMVLNPRQWYCACFCRTCKHVRLCLKNFTSCIKSAEMCTNMAHTPDCLYCGPKCWASTLVNIDLLLPCTCPQVLQLCSKLYTSVLIMPTRCRDMHHCATGAILDWRVLKLRAMQQHCFCSNLLQSVWCCIVPVLGLADPLPVWLLHTLECQKCTIFVLLKMLIIGDLLLRVAIAWR
jgi:hypothetical protein